MQSQSQSPWSWSPPPANQSRLGSLENVSPSIIIIILILSVTIFVSVSLCLLLRFLRRSPDGNSERVSPETSIIDSLPLFTFSSVTRRQSNSSGDCPVCLSKFEPEDQLRLLPLCCHAFHAHCIDVWLNTNHTCPLCRSPIHASDSDVIKATLLSQTDSFRLDIGSVSRRQLQDDPPQQAQRNSFSIGSFEYVVEQESEVVRSQTHHFSDKAPDPALVGAGGRSWLKDYMERLSASISSRSLSFRSSGRFFTGSSRRTDFQATNDYDLESNRIGEEITEMFRWFSGV